MSSKKNIDLKQNLKTDLNIFWKYLIEWLERNVALNFFFSEYD